MQREPHYGDVVAEVRAFLAERVAAAEARASLASASSSIPASVSARPPNTISSCCATSTGSPKWVCR